MVGCFLGTDEARGKTCKTKRKKTIKRKQESSKHEQCARVFRSFLRFANFQSRRGFEIVCVQIIRKGVYCEGEAFSEMGIYYCSPQSGSRNTNKNYRESNCRNKRILRGSGSFCAHYRCIARHGTCINTSRDVVLVFLLLSYTSLLYPSVSC